MELGIKNNPERLLKETDPNKEILEKFTNKKLLVEIKKELDQDHLEDDNLKMTTFLCAVSGLLKNQEHRKSIALKGDSSVGKDNLIKTILKHIPEEPSIFLTNATQATLEDDIHKKRIIAFSEINSHRESGANKHLTEVIKQKTEGGTSALKKDIRDGMKTARHEIGEQGSVLYGTTESEKDEEMGTRFIEGSVMSNPIKTKKVNDKTLDNISNMDSIIFKNKKENSWIKKGLSLFYINEEQFEFVIPYANFLKEKIDGEHIFDNKNPRSQRDLKRLLSLTCAMTYLFQKQRNIVNHKGIKFLVCEPQDFINTLEFSAEFFNQTYVGFDSRISEVLGIITEYEQEWTPRDFIQEKLGKSRNTIKSYCSTLSQEGIIEGVNGKELNERESLKMYDSNKIFYRKCQKGIKKPLIRCQVSRLKEFLEVKTQKTIDTFEELDLSTINNEKEGVKGIKKQGVNLEDNGEIGTKREDFDTFKLTPFKDFSFEDSGIKEELENE